ncbi:MAG TPA: cation diffusion facilitator family transporter [Gaiellaceae bacterium]|nr:cation diffusion facilitator family transporter [Gaiellaceae bacterium]
MSALREDAPSGDARRTLLTRLILLSLAAAVATIALKTVAWRLTGSVGLLSDAVESLVNFVAAAAALVAIRWATRPPDAEHMYGHEKAEYFAAGVEGIMIVAAAASIAWVAVARILHPAPIEDVGVGLAVSGTASAINLAVGLALIRAGRRHRSIALEADGRHLMTDVWTSVGVIIGVGAVALTGWRVLDPVVALAVAANIVVTGVTLMRRSGGGLMDRVLPDDERAAIDHALAPFASEGVRFHALRTRRSGRRSFVSVHVLVPGAWSVQEGHRLLERIESAVRAAVPGASVFTHLEPAEDPTSLDDVELERRQEVPPVRQRP